MLPTPQFGVELDLEGRSWGHTERQAASVSRLASSLSDVEIVRVVLVLVLVLLLYSNGAGTVM